MTYLSFLRSPVSIGVSVENHLARSSVAHFRRGVREGALSAPLELVACRLGDEERL